jgi:hypothetical protein
MMGYHRQCTKKAPNANWQIMDIYCFAGLMDGYLEFDEGLNPKIWGGQRWESPNQSLSCPNLWEVNGVD